MSVRVPTLIDPPAGAADGRGSPASPIRVLVADDSAFMRTALTRMVESDPGLKVVGAARDGVETLQLAATLRPDVITLDIEMPRMDGLAVLRRLMEENPLPVVIVSSLSQEGAEATLQGFDLGAFDCIPKQLGSASLNIVNIRDQLVAQIKAAASSPLLRARTAAPKPPVAVAAPAYRGFRQPEIVVLGTSTGGPGALREIIPALPADLAAGLLVVQHMPPGFTAPLARRLNSLSAIAVHEATDGRNLQPGEVLIAPAGFQTTVERSPSGQPVLRVGTEPTGTQHKPSVDVTMLSAAETFGARAMGVILTGMGSDGARGMAAIHERGGFTVGQDEKSSVVYGMPRACAERGVLRRVVPLDSISAEIIAAVRNQRS